VPHSKLRALQCIPYCCKTRGTVIRISDNEENIGDVIPRAENRSGTRMGKRMIAVRFCSHAVAKAGRRDSRITADQTAVSQAAIVFVRHSESPAPLCLLFCDPQGELDT
jgi:hypothetical protein